MRLLQLSLDPDEPAALDLHPLVSVVQGLDERARDRLVRSLAAVAAGSEPPCPGTAEVHGVVLPLDRANLSLLDLGGPADPIVRRSDLPGAIPHPSEVAADPSVDPVEEILQSAPEGVDPELDEARRHHHDTREALRVLREMTDDTSRQLHEVGDQRSRIEDAVAAAARGLDAEPALDEVAVLEGDLEAIDAGIAELAGLDLDPVRVLLDAIEHPLPADEVPDPVALALADEIRGLHGQIAANEARLEAEGRGPAAAFSRLEAARSEATAAEASLTRPPVSNEDEQALRAAHEAVLDAEQKASGLRSRSGQRKLAAALGRQQEILDRVGYPTWSAYVMGASLMGVDEAARHRLESAERELAEAEQAWAQVTAALEGDPEHHALLDRLEDLEVEAISVLLGRGMPVPEEREGIEDALRQLRTTIPVASEGELIATLAHALAGLGLPVEAHEPERVLVTAHALLEEFAGVPARLEELAGERRRTESLLADARSRAEARAWADLQASVDRPSAGQIVELEAELASVRETEEVLAETLEARNSLVEAAALAERAAGRRARAAAQAVLDTTPSTPGVDELWSEVDAEAIELYLLARLSAVRDVSYAGSVPLLLVDTFRGLPDDVVREILVSIARMSETTQLLLLTDDALVAAWAFDQGIERAAVVRVASVYV